MKRELKIWILICLAGMLHSCNITESFPDGPEPGEGGGSDTKAYVSFCVQIDPELETRADEEDVGMSWEQRVRDIRIILYNTDGIAKYIFNFNNIPSDLKLPAPDYQTYGLEVKKQNYRVVVQVNAARPDPKGQGIDFLAETANVGHSIDVYSQPVNFKDMAMGTPMHSRSGDDCWRYFAFMSLTGTYESIYVTKDNGYKANGATSFFMCNADGITLLPASEVRESVTAAEANPITIRVERAVAKVAMFKSPTLEVPQGVVITDLLWRTENQNMWVYPMRQRTYASTGSMEKASDPQSVRYAIDPNFYSHSRLRYTYNGQTVPYPASEERNNPTNHFELLKRMRSTYCSEELYPGMFGMDFLFSLTWATGTTHQSTPTSSRSDFEYVMENTMGASEQYEDVTTRVVAIVGYNPNPSSYCPVKGQSSIRGLTPTSAGFAVSYYTYGGYTFTRLDMNSMFKDHTLVPDFLPGLRTLLDTEGTKILQDLNFTGVLATYTDQMEPDLGPAVGYSYKGFCFYKDTNNYYTAKIRHFDDTQSPSLMGYGRYGVVRNNYYKLTVTKFSDFGSPTYPDPEGPDDDIVGRIAIQVEVLPWGVRDNDQELGENIPSPPR